MQKARAYYYYYYYYFYDLRLNIFPGHNPQLWLLSHTLGVPGRTSNIYILGQGTKGRT
jgi:hypothetical protein